MERVGAKAGAGEVKDGVDGGRENYTDDEYPGICDQIEVLLEDSNVVAIMWLASITVDESLSEDSLENLIIVFPKNVFLYEKYNT